MLIPCCTKNVGSHCTKPKISVLIMINATEPTTMLGKRLGASRDERLNDGIGVAGAGGGSGPAVAASFSIAAMSASASAARPLDSSQRGDSGSALRRYQTMSAPTPAMTNIGRQPKFGMIAKPSSAVAGRPDTTTKAMNASHQPRDLGGTNSVKVE